ncbi:MAG: hypothetical protein LBR21_03545 [Propionibacteriaceae bacterium]|jgi:hypothetical protein|nr:hypothetical protein [Propionibacteriaceae bacterium]
MAEPPHSRIGDERGQSSLALVILVPAIVALAVLLITMVEGAALGRQNAVTAADSAADAAVEVYRSSLAELAEQALDVSGEERANLLKDVMAGEPGDWYGDPAWELAGQIADLNGAELLELEIAFCEDDLAVCFLASVRNKEVSPGTDVILEATGERKLYLDDASEDFRIEDQLGRPTVQYFADGEYRGYDALAGS